MSPFLVFIFCIFLKTFFTGYKTWYTILTKENNSYHQKAPYQQNYRDEEKENKEWICNEINGKPSGGSAWESNPPNGLLTRYTGFEVRESHQCPIHFPANTPHKGEGSLLQKIF
jgi:hypothetical protein